MRCHSGAGLTADSPRSSLKSQARASAQSRSTVAGATPTTAAASSTVSPPKNRSSTSSLCRGSSHGELLERARRDRARRRRGDRPPVSASWSGTRCPPSRLTAPRLRAWSTSTRRITCAAIAKKCARFCQRTCRWSISLRYASWTSAVGVERVVGALAAQMAARQPAQLVVHGIDETGAGRLIPVTPSREQGRHVGVVTHAVPCALSYTSTRDDEAVLPWPARTRHVGRTRCPPFTQASALDLSRSPPVLAMRPDAAKKALKEEHNEVHKSVR